MNATPQHCYHTDQPWVTDSCITLDRPLPLECGGKLEQARVAYRLVGDPSMPIVLALGGISASRKTWCAADEAGAGWWQDQVGPDLALDTRHYCVLGIDYLGGNGDTESPRLWGDDGANFPRITTLDQAVIIVRLLQALGISTLESVVGASYGGMVALHLAALAPARLRHCLVICAAHEASPQSSAWRHVQRQILELGLQTGQEFTALKLARSLAICGYRSEQEFATRFKTGALEGPESVTAYLDHCGTKFASGFDIHSYLCLSESIDSHQFSTDEAVVPVDILGFNSDQLVPVHQLIRLRKKLGTSGKLNLKPSLYGHDAFLKERQAVAGVISDHLEYIL